MNRLSFWGRSEKIAIFFTLSPNRESVHRLVLGRLINGEGLNPRGLLIGIEKAPRNILAVLIKTRFTFTVFELTFKTP